MNTTLPFPEFPYDEIHFIYIYCIMGYTLVCLSCLVHCCSYATGTTTERVILRRLDQMETRFLQQKQTILPYEQSLKL